METTITNPNPAGPNALPTGTHTDIQSAMMIFTGKHYSSMTDTGAKPRPPVPFKVPGNATLEEMRAQWGPFNANTGTYELTGSTLTLRPIVAKNPQLQNKGFIRFTTKLDGNNLWLTLIEVSTQTAEIANPSTIKYTRVE